MHINTYYLVYAKSSLSTSLGIGVATPCAGIPSIVLTRYDYIYCSCAFCNFGLDYTMTVPGCSEDSHKGPSILIIITYVGRFGTLFFKASCMKWPCYSFIHAGRGVTTRNLSNASSMQ